MQNFITEATPWPISERHACICLHGDSFAMCRQLVYRCSHLDTYIWFNKEGRIQQAQLKPADDSCFHAPSLNKPPSAAAILRTRLCMLSIAFLTVAAGNDKAVFSNLSMCCSLDSFLFLCMEASCLRIALLMALHGDP